MLRGKLSKRLIKQREKIDYLYHKFQLTSLEDWNNISKRKITQNGGEDLLYYFENDKEKLLNKLYPNFPWDFAKYNSRGYFKSISNQQTFMDEIFTKLNYNSLDEFQKITLSKIRELNGQRIIKYYKDNIRKLLMALYPNYPWKFNEKMEQKIPQRKKDFNNLEKQQKYMENLYNKLKLKSVEEWLKMSRKKIILNGGFALVKYFSNDFNLLLKTIYPNFPWEFEQLKYKSKFFLSLKNQTQFIEYLYYKYHLTSFDQLYKITAFKIRKNGGKSILKIYLNDVYRLFRTIYPNFPFNFKEKKKKWPANYFKKIENQRQFLDHFYHKMQCESLSQLLSISKQKIIKNGGVTFLSLYSFDLNKILLKNYPNYPWKNEIFWEKNLFTKEAQQRVMNHLFEKLKLRRIEDWLTVSRFQMLLNGGQKILKFYSNCMANLLQEIYPNFDWKFEEDERGMKFRPHVRYHRTLDFTLKKILFIKRKYSIKKKEDWYRLPYKYDEIELFRSLKLIFPTEKWNKKKFLSRSKKLTQRLLFTFLQSIYPSFEVIENYRNPLIKRNLSLELDIFIPTLNMALEYQGEQHYDDMPGAFCFLDLYRSRDLVKINFAEENNLLLIVVPFWWDQSLLSLSSTIRHHLLYSLSRNVNNKL